MMHDKGLDEHRLARQGRLRHSLSSRQREKMQRLRTWNERFRTRDSKERNLNRRSVKSTGWLRRSASPRTSARQPRVIYRRALDDDLLPGRSIEGVSTASLYAAARQAGTPRSLDEIAGVSRVEKDEIARTYRYVVRELSLEIKPADPESTSRGSPRTSTSPRRSTASPPNHPNAQKRPSIREVARPASPLRRCTPLHCSPRPQLTDCSPNERMNYSGNGTATTNWQRQSTLIYRQPQRPTAVSGLAHSAFCRHRLRC